MFHESKQSATNTHGGTLPRSIISRKSSGAGPSGAKQRIGNQGVQRLIGRPSNPSAQTPAAIQAKLTVSEPGDVQEREADRMAGVVMRTPDSGLQETPAVHSRGAVGATSWLLMRSKILR